MELKLDKKFCRNFLITVISIFVVYLFVREIERVKGLLNTVLGLFSPFIVGAAIAFILNVPMRFVERKLSFIKNEKALRVSAICLTLLALALVVAAVMLLLVPQVEETIRIFGMQLPPFFQRINDLLLKLLEEYPQVRDFLNLESGEYGIDWMKLVENVLNALETSISTVVGSAFSLLGSVIDAVYNGVFSFIFAFYCLARKETLARQGRKLLYSVVKENKADELIRVLRMSNSIFSNFITGQCLDALILGCMCAIAMAILRMPYIPLICVIIVVTALIPVMGALIGCAIGAFLIFVNSPIQALFFIVMFIVVQQIDNNIVYPRVVGSSIGLPGMWVLVAVLVGEEIMGVAGMLLMVPFASVLYTLLREFAHKRVQERQINSEKLQCQPPELQPHFVVRRRIEKKKNKQNQQQAKNEQPQT